MSIVQSGYCVRVGSLVMCYTWSVDAACAVALELGGVVSGGRTRAVAPHRRTRRRRNIRGAVEEKTWLEESAVVEPAALERLRGDAAE
jgi:hypothetical protein